jgi:ArsR family transcriptional regulator
MATAPPHPALFATLAEWFGALSDSTRLRLVWELKQGEANVSTLVAATGIAQASVSKHLATLRQAGLVEVRREGQQAIYRIADPALLEICSIVCGSVTRRQTELAQALAPQASATTENAPF